MSTLLSRISETVSYLQNIYPETPEAGIVLGSGLGNFASEIEVIKEIPYNEIPHFPVSTVQGHKGKLIFGSIAGKRVVAMAGRFHFYEGYSADEVVFPIRVMKFLGIKYLFLSNAAGGVNPAYNVGDLMIIRDHISFGTWNPLIGKNENELGPRFPDMSEPYRKDMIRYAKQVGQELGIKLHEGVYYGVTGPTFETRAEYKLIHIVGGDAVGMGIREEENVITHEEVLQAAAAAEPKLTAIFKRLIASVH